MSFSEWLDAKLKKMRDSRDRAASRDSVVSVRTIKWCWSGRVLTNALWLIASGVAIVTGWHFSGWSVAGLTAYNLIATLTAHRVIRK